MATQTLIFLDLAEASTSAPNGFGAKGGGGNLVGQTVTFASGATTRPVTIEDADDRFEDDTREQTLTASETFNGTSLPAGTVVENEYLMVLSDGTTTWEVVAVSAKGQWNNIVGFSFHGDPPPFGTPLKVLSTSDMDDDARPYAAPPCFTPGTRIATPAGLRAVETLRVGDLATTPGGAEPVRLILRRRLTFAPGPHPHRPVRIAAGAFGPGLPDRALTVSPQHRILLRDGPGGELRLVPAKALVARPGVRVLGGIRQVDYIHIAFARHAVVWSNGLMTESLLPGPQVLAGLSPADRQRLDRVLPEPERPAAPCFSVLPVREGLARSRGLSAVRAGALPGCGAA